MTTGDAGGLVEHRGFTPGPWYEVTRQASWDWVVARSQREEICQMFHDGTEFNETGEANAKLVADAPNLYQKLLAIRNAVRLAKQTGDNEGAIRVITEALGE